MNIVKKIFKKLTKTVGSTLTTKKSNPYLYGIIIIALTMYGPRLSPGLPAPIKKIFNSPIFRILVLTLVIYLTNKDLSMALIISIGFVLVVSLSSSLETFEYFENGAEKEYGEKDEEKDGENQARKGE